MKKLVLLVAILAFATSLNARDDVKYHSLDFLNGPKAKNFLLPNVSISFGTGYSGQVIVKDLTSNKKTNGFNKSDEEACQIALLSALKTFQERALKEGGTKVVNLTGYYKKHPFNSKTQFQCGSGALMSGVTLKGDIAK
ncbi:excinuclease ABC subunit A [Campylobacter concisus]|uniref:Excinuclease ABC subunit A n=1 Tax=Campylobacter concisus TaxID=199 RepID=A0A1X0U3D5_9BACT|nr:excinuclease ABC subunit A [Campylobacter concisus]